jgi:hypothetical protein
MKEEKIFKASSGYLFLILGLLLIGAAVMCFIGEIFWLGAILFLSASFCWLD